MLILAFDGVSLLWVIFQFCLLGFEKWGDNATRMGPEGVTETAWLRGPWVGHYRRVIKYEGKRFKKEKLWGKKKTETKTKKVEVRVTKPFIVIRPCKCPISYALQFGFSCFGFCMHVKIWLCFNYIYNTAYFSRPFMSLVGPGNYVISWKGWKIWHLWCKYLSRWMKLCSPYVFCFLISFIPSTILFLYCDWRLKEILLYCLNNVLVRRSSSILILVYDVNL